MLDTALQIIERYAVPFTGAVLFAFVVRLFFMMRKLERSFTKLGYFTREDTKKYFDEAAQKATELNTHITEGNKKVVEEGMMKAMVKSGTVMEKALADSQQQAAEIILDAKDNAQQIIIEAQARANEQYDQSLDKAVAALEWVLGEYLKENFDIKEHRSIIEGLIEVYKDDK